MADAGAPAPEKKRKPVGVANVARREWDKEAFQAKADAKSAAVGGGEREGAGGGGAARRFRRRPPPSLFSQTEAAQGETALEARKRKRLERDPLKQGVIVERSHLKARAAALDLTAALNKRQSVVAGAVPASQAGYYCAVCDCSLKDSTTYLDHVNGKWHNRALGMSMRVERVGVAPVKERLAALTAAKEREKKEREAAGAEGPSAADPESVLGKRLAAAAEAEAAAKAEAAARREAKKKALTAAADGSDEDDPEAAAMAAAMGFGGFGGK
jgi:U4/U6.U5 tri-snRNP component SNU23